MSRIGSALRLQIAIVALVSAAGAVPTAGAVVRVPGVKGPSITITAMADRISTPDGHSIYFWGFAGPGQQRPQYPGPTLRVQKNQAVQITVVIQLPGEFQQRVSLSLAGQTGVTAACNPAGGCVQGPIALEARAGESVTYTFTASRPGTFLYGSASNPDLQIEMGLAGALLVYPSDPDTATKAYDDTAPASQAGNPAGSQFEQEYLFFLSEMDSEIHDLVEQRGVQAAYDSGRLGYYFPNYWFINGRNAPDTMAEANVARLPTQPYGALTRTHPGDRILMRVVGGGHDMHPFHHHGQHARVIAVDGAPLQTAANAHFDLSHEVFTIQSLPGQTIDAILRWTGKGLGWDIYGGSDSAVHLAGSCSGSGVHVPLDAEGLDPVTHEYCADHGKPLPVVLPEALALTNGPFYSGSPFLGQVGLMPPGDGGLNPNAGYTYMWHSHNEKEITNFDIFPGGMMTMLVVEPPGTPIP
jgi:FtsP/CotA-like multicopper oxidase with cupredoxin domain